MNTTTNPLAMTNAQKFDATADKGITLNAAQRSHLRTHGLLAQAQERWKHLDPAPTGERRVLCGMDQPRIKKPHREAAPTVNVSDRTCRECHEAFEPRRPFDYYCKSACFTKNNVKRSR